MRYITEGHRSSQKREPIFGSEGLKWIVCGVEQLVKESFSGATRGGANLPSEHFFFTHQGLRLDVQGVWTLCAVMRSSCSVEPLKLAALHQKCYALYWLEESH